MHFWSFLAFSLINPSYKCHFAGESSTSHVLHLQIPQTLIFFNPWGALYMKSKVAKKKKKQDSSNDNEISDKKILESLVEKDLKRWQGENEQGCATYKLVETYKYVMALSAPYYNDYNKYC